MKYLLIIFLISPLCAFAQKTNSINKNAKVEIQYINNVNETLKKVLEGFIENQEANNDLFKSGFGYITIDELDFIKYKTLDLNLESTKGWSDTLITFNVGLNSYFVNGNEDPGCFNCNYFPPFYTKIDG